MVHTACLTLLTAQQQDQTAFPAPTSASVLPRPHFVLQRPSQGRKLRLVMGSDQDLVGFGAEHVMVRMPLQPERHGAGRHPVGVPAVADADRLVAPGRQPRPRQSVMLCAR
jgi:hypothetical protein